MFVKFILPALTEANSPLFRPIKYSLFPPRGLAALAAYLDDSDHAVAIFLAGLRDAAARRRAKDLSSADLFTAAPGDPEVIAAITRCLS